MKGLPNKAIIENQKRKRKWKIKVLSLVSGSNEDGISKSNTQITVIINRHSKKHPQIEVNQTELPQLKKFFSSFI